ncbi:hypothetical protein F511_30363 [Dorcoceras hygrometricum]|uniref:Uncharacterized protein n=1 Tax=Dorcoceras hygrometricum TaxID=472368 RepID=A0A2Z7BVJ1_9LAMI|nr:hypothetical protein F511_30363 [Dorcoceras hygrometricum]
MRFTTDDITLGDEPTAFLPPYLTSELAQLRASVDQISLEHVQTKIQIERLKEEFFAKISILETLLLTRADNQDRAAVVQTEIFRKEVVMTKRGMWIAAKAKVRSLLMIGTDLVEDEAVEVSMRRREVVVRKVVLDTEDSDTGLQENEVE